MAEPTHAGRPSVVDEGRDLDALQAMATDAMGGRGSLVLLSGAPGSGRTRLAERLAGWAQGRGMRALWSRAVAAGGAGSLAPWADVVRAAVGDADPARLVAELEGQATAPHALGLVPELIPGPWPPEDAPPPDRLALFDGTTILLRHLARTRPLLVVLDDFDTAGITAHRFLEFVLPGLAETAMLIVAISRPGDPWLDRLGDHAHRVALGLGGSLNEAAEPGDEGSGADPALAEQAGDDAMGELAWEDAAEHYRRALDGQPGVDADTRFRVLLGLGAALSAAGDASAARSAYQDAAGLARRRGRSGDVARAALGLSSSLRGFQPSPPDPAAISLLEEALTLLGDDAEETYAGLLARVDARLSMALGPDAGVAERRRRLSDDAVALARQVDDPAALVDALASRCDALAGPSHRQARLDAADEMVAVAVGAADREAGLLGRRLRVVALLEDGRLTAADAEISEFASIADRIGQPRFTWIVALWGAMRALLQGRFAESERRNAWAAALGRRAGVGRVDTLCMVQFFHLRVAQDRVVELEMAARSVTSRPDDRVASEATTVQLLGLLGRDGEAGVELAVLAADRFAAVDPDPRWLATMAALAEVAATLDQHSEAAVLYELLVPHARCFAIEAMGATCHGSVSRHLGLLAHALGRWDEADDHFRRALADNEAAGAPLLVAHTRLQWSALLRARDLVSDWERGLELLTGAEVIYRRLGVDRLADEARQVLARSHEPPASERSGAGNAFRRQGDAWVLSYGGVEVRLADSLGMHDLGTLLANPDRSFHVTDLVAGASPPDVDARARAEYRARLAELDEETADPILDPVRVSLALAERDFIAGELAFASDAPQASVTDPVERARRAVATRMRLCLDRIDAAHPTLGRHLRHSVRTGTFCSYEPEMPTTWKTGEGS
ncbi:MAG TPA: ATP-binding protein [Acidimicrobiales bacterium]|nr:ATP-binding protein [Acidimicrobiales bacterium]